MSSKEQRRQENCKQSMMEAKRNTSHTFNIRVTVKTDSFLLNNVDTIQYF